MSIRKSNLVLGVLAAGGVLFAAALVHSALAGRHDPGISTRLVQQLGLSDLALFTEARYTRHPSQADLHSAFQDHPGALDHFPTGSLVPPPYSFGPTGGFATGGQE
jgi:hypothetical protein